jgi:phage gp36-like protein
VSQYADSDQFERYGLPAVALEDMPVGFDLDSFLITASGVADSFLRGRYALPIGGTAPVELTAAVCQIAAYDVLVFRGFDPSSGNDTNVRNRRDDAMAWLKGISDGKLNLDLGVDDTPGAHDGGPRVRSRRRRSVDGCDDDEWCDFWGNR